MKKVLALVLAVIMVCTMAMAITVNNGGNAAVSDSSTYTNILPGSTIYFTLDELLDGDDIPVLTDKKTIAIDSVKVTVTYGKGAELVASHGWVKVAKEFGTNGVEKTTNYQYQIVLKSNPTAVFNKNVCDFSITKVTAKVTTELENAWVFDGKLASDSTTENVKYATGHAAKYERAYGYPADDASAQILTNTWIDLNLPEKTVYTVNAGIKADGTSVNKGFYSVALVAGPAATGKVIDDEDTLDIAVTAGQKFNVLPAEMNPVANIAGWQDKCGFDASKEVAHAANNTTLPATLTLTGVKATWNVYTVATNGAITKVNGTMDDGVGTYAIPASSLVLVYDGILKGATVTGTTTGSTGTTTTNPGTGANDVVGVAAALAVVALVSGAAISLKK